MAASAPCLWLSPLEAGATAREVLSAQERLWAEALPPAVALRYRSSRALLRLQLAEQLEMEAAAVPLHAPPGQPPRLEDGRGWVSLSHCPGALLTAWSPWPIGVDLEELDRPLVPLPLLRRHFPLPEQRELLQGPWAEDPALLRRAVLRSWVHKEAAIKWRGRSLAGELRHWCFGHAQGRLHQLQDHAAPPCWSRRCGPWLLAAVGEGVAELVFRKFLS
ncbi:MAG: 4'-phosphopantetheinyl transferase superfamily protein [Synechococcus sp.]|nr:4'-phosphopantetheinyl transferase superfamily protein [Synechococcus sp.]